MGSIQEEYLVYFFEPKARYSKYIWWSWNYTPRFTHCGSLNYNPDKKIWNHIQFTHAGIKIELLDEDQASELLAKLHGFEILICPVKDDWQIMRIKELSCVSFTMRLIGFYKWWIVTPYQLYCALIKAGYKSFWKNRDNHGKKTKNT